MDCSSVLLLTVEPTPAAKKDFGFSLFLIFHIVRAVIFRCLWTHRNDLRFDHVDVDLIHVKAQVHAVITLHTD